MARIFDVIEYPSEMKDEIVHRFPETGIGDFRIGSQVIVQGKGQAVGAVRVHGTLGDGDDVVWPEHAEPRAGQDRFCDLRARQAVFLDLLRQPESGERLRPRLAVQMIIAWRIHYVTLVGRECPELPAEDTFRTPRRWASSGWAASGST